MFYVSKREAYIPRVASAAWRASPDLRSGVAKGGFKE